MEQKSQIIINLLKSKGINFVCIDFDQTIVSHHTYGRWMVIVSYLVCPLHFYIIINLF
jgi:predicted HAD superfamily phosphohydrolase YqeG